MTPEALAALHARCFDGAPRPWAADEFRALMADPAVELYEIGGKGFLLTRRAGPEIEILTLCTDPAHRRGGVAAALLATLADAAARAGAEDILLEVAETNRAARALYRDAGYAERGTRKDYYADGGRRRVNALVLALRIGQRA